MVSFGDWHFDRPEPEPAQADAELEIFPSIFDEGLVEEAGLDQVLLVNRCVSRRKKGAGDIRHFKLGRGRIVQIVSVNHGTVADEVVLGVGAEVRLEELVVDHDVAVDKDDELRPGESDPDVSGGGRTAPLDAAILERITAA